MARRPYKEAFYHESWVPPEAAGRALSHIASMCSAANQEAAKASRRCLSSPIS